MLCTSIHANGFRRQVFEGHSLWFDHAGHGSPTISWIVSKRSPRLLIDESIASSLTVHSYKQTIAFIHSFSQSVSQSVNQFRQRRLTFSSDDITISNSVTTVKGQERRYQSGVVVQIHAEHHSFKPLSSFNWLTSSCSVRYYLLPQKSPSIYTAMVRTQQCLKKWDDRKEARGAWRLTEERVCASGGKLAKVPNRYFHFGRGPVKEPAHVLQSILNQACLAIFQQ